MGIKKVLCHLGVHDYRLKRKIFNKEQKCVKTYYICRNCEKIKEYDGDKEAEKANLNSLKKKDEEKE
jgi:hypothetical protein